MKGYIISVAAAAVVSAVMTMLTPKGWSKYVGMVTGLVVVMCIGRPVLELINTDFLEDFDYTIEEHRTEADNQLMEEIQSELKRQVEEDAEARLEKEFGRRCIVNAEISVNHAGQITGIESMTVYGSGIDNAAIGRLREVYGVREVRLDEYSKVSEKQE